jgi:hypothetical protein
MTQNGHARDRSVGELSRRMIEAGKSEKQIASVAFLQRVQWATQLAYAGSAKCWLIPVY